MAPMSAWSKLRTRLRRSRGLVVMTPSLRGPAAVPGRPRPPRRSGVGDEYGDQVVRQSTVLGAVWGGRGHAVPARVAGIGGGTRGRALGRLPPLPRGLSVPTDLSGRSGETQLSSDAGTYSRFL